MSGAGIVKSSVPSPTFEIITVVESEPPVAALPSAESGENASRGAPSVVAETTFEIGPGLPYSSSARSARKRWVENGSPVARKDSGLPAGLGSGEPVMWVAAEKFAAVMADADQRMS